MRCGSVTSREIAYAKTWRSFWSRTIGEIWASCPVCTEQSVTGEFSPNWKRGDEDRKDAPSVWNQNRNRRRLEAMGETGLNSAEGRTFQ